MLPWGCRARWMPGKDHGPRVQWGGWVGAGCQPWPVAEALPALAVPSSAPAALQLFPPDLPALASRFADSKRFVMCWSNKGRTGRRRWPTTGTVTRREPRSPSPPAAGLRAEPQPRGSRRQSRPWTRRDFAGREPGGSRRAGGCGRNAAVPPNRASGGAAGPSGAPVLRVGEPHRRGSEGRRLPPP